MPPRTDDQFDNDHMVMPAMEMNAKISAICDSYGVDVWVWYPNLGKNFESAEAVDFELKEREEFFQRMSRINHVFVPGGDPGDIEPDVFFAFLKKVVPILHRYHPHAKIWVSPQSLKPTKGWHDAFFRHVNEKYDWLGGVVFGPYTKTGIEEIRNRVRPDIPIRRYPDITHSVRCQYPYYNWDVAWATTLAREPINPRPVDQKAIHNAFKHLAVGSITYSEGINDDVNKFVWSGQDWDPETPVMETLRDYARFFIGPDYTEDFASGLFALERNMRGPIAANTSVEATFNQFRNMEENASQSLLSNYRFQLALIRAYYDLYIFRRYFYEKELEQQAKVILLSVTEGDSLSALEKAKEILLKTGDKSIMSDIREKTIALSDSLFRSIGMQLSVVRHRGRPDRGVIIDHIDIPVTDAAWFISNINRIEEIPDEATRREEIRNMMERTNPGPGGIYDNFGPNTTISGKIKRDIPWEKDPGNLKSYVIDVGLGLDGYGWPNEIMSDGYWLEPPPAAWMTHLTAFFTQPLVVSYDNLDPDSQYKLRVTYTGRFRSSVKLYANDVLIHDFIRSGRTPTHEFPIPQEVTKDGRLELKWIANDVERGAQIAELWIIKEK